MTDKAERLAGYRHRRDQSWLGAGNSAVRRAVAVYPGLGLAPPRAAGDQGAIGGAIR